MKKLQYYLLLLLLLINLSFCIEPKEETITHHIVFTNRDIKIYETDAAIIDDTKVLIHKPGVFLLTGESEEGNIIVNSSSVTIFLQNLYLSSKKNAPIIVNSNIRDIKIINLKNSTLFDLENRFITTGECAVVRIKRNCIVYFENRDIFTLYGECKYGIKGGIQTSIIFEKAGGEYIINTKKTSIDSDGFLEFNGGIFTIDSQNGDAIKSFPKFDPISVGKILINDGIFKIYCFNDAFTAKNNITILKGDFNIITKNGYDTEIYNETESSKGFKIANNETGCEMKIYSGYFKINAADDAFHSKRDITILGGNFEINTKDDGFCAMYNLVLGKKNASFDELFINIKNSYQALEGMTVSIFSGKIICNAKDNGINASGQIIKGRRNHIPGNESEWRSKNITNNETEWEQRNNSTSNPWEEGDWRKIIPDTPPNDNYIISIYDGDITLYTDSNGFNSKGHIYINGGHIYIFSEGIGFNEPIKHNGNFTLFNAEVLGVGSKGLEFVHEGIKKGNEMYAIFYGNILKNKILEIRDENNKVIIQGGITKDINYIFYTALNLNEKFCFYILDEIENKKTKLNMTFRIPEKGEDDEDKNYYNGKNKKSGDKVINSSNWLKSFLVGSIIFLF